MGQERGVHPLSTERYLVSHYSLVESYAGCSRGGPGGPRRKRQVSRLGLTLVLPHVVSLRLDSPR